MAEPNRFTPRGDGRDLRGEIGALLMIASVVAAVLVAYVAAWIGQH